MKGLRLIAVLLAGGAAFYFWGGLEKFGLVRPKKLPDTIEQRDATFMGTERANPYAE